MGASKTLQQRVDQYTRFLEHYTYDPETGEFAFNDSGCRRDISADGYIRLYHSLNTDRRFIVFAHRLAYFAATGTSPLKVGHRNGKFTDNRAENLVKTARYEQRGTPAGSRMLSTSCDKNDRVRVKISPILDCNPDAEGIDYRVKSICRKYTVIQTGEVNAIPAEEVDTVVDGLASDSEKIMFLRRLAICKKGYHGAVIKHVPIHDQSLPYFVRRRCYTAGIPNDIVTQLVRLVVISGLTPSTAVNRIIFPEGMNVSPDLVSTVAHSCRPVSMTEWTYVYLSDVRG